MIISNSFPPNFDGVGDYSYHLLSLLIKEGFDSGVVTSFSDYFTYTGSNIQNIYPIIHKWNFNGCLQLYKLIKKKQINTLLIQYVPYAFNKSGFPLTFILFIGLFRFNGIHIHTNFHEVAIRFRGESLILQIRAICQRTLAYLLCLFSKTIQTSNKYYASLLVPFKATIVPIPSNFEFVVPNSTPIKSHNTVVIVTNANRCIAALLNAVAILKRLIRSEIKLYIIGRAYPMDLTAINQLLSEYDLANETSFFVNEKAQIIVHAMLESDIFIQLESITSKGSGGVSSKSGTTAAAMHLGIPIISTCGDMTDMQLFKDEETICFVPVADSNRIAKKILKILNNKALYDTIRMNAKDSYKSSFAWTNTLNYHLKSVLKYYN